MYYLYKIISFVKILEKLKPSLKLHDMLKNVLNDSQFYSIILLQYERKQKWYNSISLSKQRHYCITFIGSRDDK